MDTAPRPDPAAPYWDVREVAAELGLRPTTVYDLIASGRLVCYRFGPRGGRIRVRPADVEAYAESCRVGARAESGQADPDLIPIAQRRELYRPPPGLESLY
jgi:excisionase family DNA binding protein